MKQVLVIGAGRSSAALIDDLLTHAETEDWRIVVGDAQLEAALERIGGHPRGVAIPFDLGPGAQTIIRESDLVISLLPATLHPEVARWCLAEGKDLLTASYVSQELREIDEAVKAKGLLFLNECGLDPGIDHMSAMQLMDNLRRQGGRITSFKSFTGGLIAPDTDPGNPWRYKFTWNPRNVVMAGQGTARFLQDHRVRFVPYHQLMRRTTPIEVPGLGEFEGYANRDSLGYQEIYGLGEVSTLIRGTLRNTGYCSAWNVLIQLGCCDETSWIDEAGLTAADFIASYLPEGTGSLRSRIKAYLGAECRDADLDLLEWSGFFADKSLSCIPATPARIVEEILHEKWRLQPGDRDMIVMWHCLEYEKNGHAYEVQASLVVTGEDSAKTAMAKTVGLPLAIAARLRLKGLVKATGVVIPVQPEWYNPVMAELKLLGIQLVEHERQIR